MPIRIVIEHAQAIPQSIVVAETRVKEDIFDAS